MLWELKVIVAEYGDPFSMFTGIRQNVEQDDADQQRFLDDLISQLLDEAQTNAKGPPPASDRFIKSLPRVALSSLARYGVFTLSYTMQIGNNPIILIIAMKPVSFVKKTFTKANRW